MKLQCGCKCKCTNRFAFSVPICVSHDLSCSAAYLPFTEYTSTSRFSLPSHGYRSRRPSNFPSKAARNGSCPKIQFKLLKTINVYGWSRRRGREFWVGCETNGAVRQRHKKGLIKGLSGSCWLKQPKIFSIFLPSDWLRPHVAHRSPSAFSLLFAPGELRKAVPREEGGDFDHAIFARSVKVIC